LDPPGYFFPILIFTTRREVEILYKSRLSIFLVLKGQSLENCIIFN
jgi:hypothetical protein